MYVKMIVLFGCDVYVIILWRCVLGTWMRGIRRSGIGGLKIFIF